MEPDLRAAFNESACAGLCGRCGRLGQVALCMTTLVGRLPQPGGVVPDEQIASREHLCFECFTVWMES